MANTKVPSHLTEGLAKDDLSNVNAATGLAALGAAKADLSNVDAATGRAALASGVAVSGKSDPEEKCAINTVAGTSLLYFHGAAIEADTFPLFFTGTYLVN